MRLAQTGEYHPSRLPGYPIPELFLALLYHGGPWLTNGVSALLCAMAALYALVRERPLVAGALLGAGARF